MRVESDDDEQGGSANAMLTNEVGLHARPSVKLTQLAKSFKANIELALWLRMVRGRTRRARSR